MKKPYLNLVLCFCMALTACKKNGNNVRIDEITGKWQQTKLNLHQTDGNGAVQDTTYAEADLTSQDFFQFNSDKTAITSRSGNFNFAGKSTMLLANVLFDFVIHYTYSVAGSDLKLKATGIPDNINTISNGQPFDQSETIVQLDNSHLVLRTVLYYYPTTANIQGVAVSGLITTSYFTKVK